jgi:hypothetical protein
MGDDNNLPIGKTGTHSDYICQPTLTDSCHALEARNRYSHAASSKDRFNVFSETSVATGTRLTRREPTSHLS